MAELEATTELPVAGGAATQTMQYSRRWPLPIGRIIRLGRDESKMDCATPEDDQISRFYATVEWDGSRLYVKRRGSIPDYPEPPPNLIDISRKVPGARSEVLVTECEILPGESFKIGQTIFTVHSELEPAVESPVDQTITRRTEEKDRTQLEGIPFTNPAVALKAMEQLPLLMKTATSEQGFFRQILKVIMEALPRVDAAGIVRIPPGCPPGERRIAVYESNVRSPALLGPKGFVPSRKLSYKAITETRKRSHLHVWSTDPKDSAGSELSVAADMTLATMHQQNVTPWAICTPFQDGSKFALYVCGRITGQWAMLSEAAQNKQMSELTQYQKIAELIVGIMETPLRMARLSKQNTVFRRAWPRAIWKYLEDTDRLEKMLEPAMKEVTIVFCDLRNYSLYASENASELLRAQKDIALALDVMSSTITMHDGIVSGFRGDAVLGFWGWPDTHESHLFKAAMAATHIHSRLEGDLQRRRCGLGVTRGTAVAGRMGAHDLAVVDLYGPVVNLAFRLEAMTKAFGVGIIVTQEVADGVAKSDPDGQLKTRKLGRVRAKGFPEPVAAFELYSSITPTVPNGLEDYWSDAVDLFTQGKWADAADIFSQTFAEDSAAQCFLRFMDMNKKRVPANWDGSFSPPAKD
jgi:class 3 adenylate cyclase